MSCAVGLERARRKPLVRWLAALFAVSPPAALAATLPVTNCSDNNSGSLRQVMSGAGNNDVVDASGLDGVCSLITLTTGDITTSAANLTVKGAGSNKLTVSGKYGTFPNFHTEPYRILTHNGFGTLTVQGMTLSNGDLINAAGIASGGCVYSKGNVILSDVELSECSANTTSGVAKGGGLYAKGFVQLNNSIVKYSSANGGTSGNAQGGGVYTLGNFSATGSSVRTNSAAGTSGNTLGNVGGVFALGQNVAITSSTIAGNSAGMNIGGIGVRNAAGTVTITNSTISGNTATAGSIGGIYVSAHAQYFLNSTIVLNKANTSSGLVGAAGVSLYASGASPAIVLQSSLIANNTYGASVNKDLTAIGTTVAGSKNLIRTPAASVPGDTIVGACPMLQALHSNGGATQTHALLSHSPAIDAGSNNASLSFDQRGAPFVRESGPAGTMTPVADIGAYEVNQADEIFSVDFEGCP